MVTCQNLCGSTNTHIDVRSTSGANGATSVLVHHELIEFVLTTGIIRHLGVKHHDKAAREDLLVSGNTRVVSHRHAKRTRGPTLAVIHAKEHHVLILIDVLLHQRTVSLIETTNGGQIALALGDHATIDQASSEPDIWTAGLTCIAHVLHRVVRHDQLGAAVDFADIHLKCAGKPDKFRASKLVGCQQFLTRRPRNDAAISSATTKRLAGH